ncbi:DMT family transporter [Desulfosporosinus nitroreducens]|uniref:DMT family transporter n=1 Tax=Desulfosporosinus nitroreducens TaxID=2018668 RepID=A0ABT8QVF0_9FIRM|nr:DMT family transporter [Desulfosporosinus nitroreducens]MCO1603850.1 DMT family transporter [Desulfosporosinus nitroreducens]MDO0825327.1 DMT family transporter [Desulfosporosinus nitroreducens]
MSGRTLYGHLIALLTVSIWGTTFVFTKILLDDSTPVEILFYRFLIGYCALFLLYPRTHKTKGLKEELLFFGLGLSGVSLYFLLENTALQFTLAANVGLLSGTVPILTAIVSHFFTTDERFSRKLVWGFLVAFAGTAMVIFNAQVILNLNPLGDFLALMAPLAWAFYSILLKKVDHCYNPIFVTRKTFFYGLLTVIPIMIFQDANFMPEKIVSLQFGLNIGFLGLIASALCFVTWNRAVEIIGTIKASNYIYLVPLISMVTSILVLNEKVTNLAVAGGFLILTGVYISEHGFKAEWLHKLVVKKTDDLSKQSQ